MSPTTCPTCGQAATGAERFCTNCGADLTKPAAAVAPTIVAPAPGTTTTAAAAPAAAPDVLPPSASAPALASAPQPVTTELRGVGGWLLIFCIWLTVVDSLFTLPALEYLRHGPLNWMLALSLALTAYGVFTGIQLWRARPAALMLLRVYFGLVLLETLFTIGLMFYGTYLMHVSIWSIFAWIRVAAFLVGWITYFRVSQRVRNTYGSNL